VSVLVGVQQPGCAAHGLPCTLHSHCCNLVLCAGIFPVNVAPYYAAAKGGLVHFTRSLSTRLAPHGIQLAAICPQ
jgi:NAD(P)-dependent dehydrogenase (short-subunit alcohol dehydrogenase family)